MELAPLTLPTWDTLDEEAARAAVATVERLVPRARFVAFERHAQADQAHRVAVFDVDGVAMVLVPGARAPLGFDVGFLDERAAQAFRASFKEAGHVAQQALGGPDVARGAPSELVRWLEESTSPARTVELAPFLLERTSPAVDRERRKALEGGDDPHAGVARAILAQGFRLPTSDEWEWAVSGGVRALFRWGNGWPIDTDVWNGGPFEEHRAANAFGLRFSPDPYHSELVDDPEELRGGDGGCLVCGEVGPMAWTTFASSYRYRLKVGDDRATWFEQAHPRRALSIAPSEGVPTLRLYQAPTIETSAELAALRLREPLERFEPLVLEGDAREAFARAVPDLEVVRRAHPEHDDVQILLAHALRKLGRHDEAERAIRAVIARRDHARAQVTLASVLQARGDRDGAIAAFDRAAALDGAEGASTDAADLLCAAGRFAEAADRYEAYLARNPNVGWAKIWSAYARFKADGDPALAERLVAIASGPANGVAWIATLVDEIAPGWRAE